MEKEFDQVCKHLCGILYQLYTGFSEENKEILQTIYNYDAQAVWFLKDYDYVIIIKGSWPETKYISFKFTNKFKK